MRHDHRLPRPVSEFVGFVVKPLGEFPEGVDADDLAAAALAVAEGFAAFGFLLRCAYLQFANENPTIGALGRLAYVSMRPQFLLVILVLVATSRFVRAQQYVLAIVLTLLITLSIFTFVPAVAAYAFFQVSEGAYAYLDPSVPYEHIRHLEAMRTGAHFVISERNLEGLITFPSYHTACAVIFMWALYPVSYWRWPMVVLNLAMIASTPIEGAHYFIDIFGGILVAILGIWCASAILPKLSSASWLSNLAYRPRFGLLIESLVSIAARRTNRMARPRFCPASDESSLAESEATRTPHASVHLQTLARVIATSDSPQQDKTIKLSRSDKSPVQANDRLCVRTATMVWPAAQPQINSAIGNIKRE